MSAIGRRDFSDRSLKLAFGIAIGTVPIGVARLALAKLLNTCTSPIRGLEVVGIACVFGVEKRRAEEQWGLITCCSMASRVYRITAACSRGGVRN
jgi:hypothetical protein